MKNKSLEKGEGKEIVLATITFVLIGYVGTCLMCSAQAGTEWQGAYMPLWHWPIKVLSFFRG